MKHQNAPSVLKKAHDAIYDWRWLNHFIKMVSYHSEIHPLPKPLAYLEVRDIFGRHHHGCASLGIASLPCRAMIDPEAAKSADFHTPSSRQRA